MTESNRESLRKAATWLWYRNNGIGTVTGNPKKFMKRQSKEIRQLERQLMKAKGDRAPQNILFRDELDGYTLEDFEKAMPVLTDFSYMVNYGEDSIMPLKGNLDKISNYDAVVLRKEMTAEEIERKYGNKRKTT